MTRNIGQAPQGNFNGDPNHSRYTYDSNGRIHDSRYRVHPERTQTTGGLNSTPAHPNARPDMERPTDSNTVMKRAAILSGSALALLGVGAAVVFGTNALAKKGGEALGEDIAKNLGGGASTSAPLVPGEGGSRGIDYSKIDPNTLTVDQFYNDSVYPEAYRIRWANKIIQERATPQKIAEMNALMARANKRPLGEIVPASEKNTGDQILAQQSLAGYIASTDPNPTTGKKLLAGFLSPENPGFESAKEQIGGGQDPVAATYVVAGGSMVGGRNPQETPTFYQTAINDYAPNGVPSKFMKIRNTVNDKYSEVTVKYSEGRWITVDTIAESSPDWIMSPQEITVK